MVSSATSRLPASGNAGIDPAESALLTNQKIAFAGL